MKLCKVKCHGSTRSACLATQEMFNQVENCMKCELTNRVYELIEVDTGFWGDYAFVCYKGKIEKVPLSCIYECTKAEASQTIKERGKPMKEKILNAIEFQKNKFLTVSQCLYSDEAKINNHNVDLTIKALQEQLDRLEGCEYCNCNFKMINQYVGFYPKRAEIEINDANDGDVQIEINHCPNCGRKLNAN